MWPLPMDDLLLKPPAEPGTRYTGEKPAAPRERRLGMQHMWQHMLLTWQLWAGLLAGPRPPHWELAEQLLR